ncbi:MAG: exodeoxyribonuclease VII small subunit [Clostridia bacterium]|nr:exodeoxyribonuclease VII small subunit [Clostridia bacterium]
MSNEKISFEAALKRLEEIADLLESSTTSLDESMTLFEEGVALSKECTRLLNTAKQKIATLTEVESGERFDD